MRKTIKERFWSKVDKSGECWVWTAWRHRQGYGRVRDGGRKVLAHRLSYELSNGPIPDGMHVMHSCDNPPCVKPDHLSLGTHADNMADAASKGLVPRGEESSKSRLTKSQVVEILESTESHAELGRRFGVNASSIQRIRRKEAWAHINVPSAYYGGTSS